MNSSRKLSFCGTLVSSHSGVYRFALLISAISTALSAVPAHSAPMPKMVPGDEALLRVNKLMTDISWNTSLANAEQIAQKQGKPIFWVHMLGPINGMT